MINRWMWGRISGLSAASLALALATAPTALAQSESFKATGESAYANILSAFDLDGDGQLNRREFAQGDAGDFDAVDLDGDGLLSDAELSTWQLGPHRRLEQEYNQQN
ncbi:MAG: EF-hand domain-containing protein [Pseudomonadota bacterium]